MENMNKVTVIVMLIVDIYNKIFIEILSAIIFFMIIIAFNLKKQKDNDENKKWYSYITVLKNKLKQTIVQIITFIFLIVLLKESFNIDILNLLQFDKHWKILFAIWFALHIKSGKSLYSRLNFHDFLDNVSEGKYNSYTTPDKIYMNIIDECQMNYELEFEKLSVLKSFAPVSLIPLLTGYVLEGNNMEANWNWYTVAFFVILFIYFYKVWECYKYLKIWKWKKFNTQKIQRML